MQKIRLRWIKGNILYEKKVRWLSRKTLIGVWINFDKQIVWIEYPNNKNQKLNIENWQILARLCQNLE